MVKGKLYWVVGHIYEGEWKYDDKQHGKGKMEYNTGQIQEGKWKMGLFKF